MKEFIEILSFILILGTILIILGLKHFDKPLMNCYQYVELNELNEGVCER